MLAPTNYGISDGLRSTQCAPAFPAGGGGTLTREGTLWFPTSNGLASINLHELSPDSPGDRTTPITHIVEVDVDGHAVDMTQAARIKPGAGRIQFRYSGVYLRAPERVRYSYKLEGLDRDWISAGSHRTIDYDPLPHGSYRFIVQAALAGGGSSQSQFAFEVLPRFYETGAFFFFCCLSMAALAYGYHRLRLAQIHSRFSLVVEERTRLAREIHDTLAQSFVGISLQLDTVQEALDAGSDAARQNLNRAQKMVRHSLTEARQSMATLRTSGLSEQNLPATLMAAVPRWVAGRQVDVRLNVSQRDCKLPTDLAQNLLRIAQEAVTNAVKHAMAQIVRVDLDVEKDFLYLRVEDDGKGFEPSDTFSVSGGHFGIVGMRERAKQIGGEFELASQPGGGTRVEVRIPLTISHSPNRTTGPNRYGIARWKSPFRAG
jgi:two-component sensor histidine kinase